MASDNRTEHQPDRAKTASGKTRRSRRWNESRESVTQLLPRYPIGGRFGLRTGGLPAPAPIPLLLSGGFGEPLGLMRCTPASKRPELRRRHGIDVESHVSSLRKEALCAV